MPDQVPTAIQPDSNEDPNKLEQSFEVLDRGEAGPPLSEPDPETLVSEQSDRLIANYTLATKMRKSLVEIGVTTPSEEADFTLAATENFSGQKTHTLVDQINKLTEQMRSKDENQKEAKQQQDQLETLIVEYLYNTTAFVKYVHRRGLKQNIQAIRDELNKHPADSDGSHNTTINLANTALAHLEVMGKVVTSLEALSSGVSSIMRHVYTQPKETENYQLKAQIKGFDRSIRVELGMTDEIGLSSDSNPGADLSIMIADLVDMIQLEKIAELKTGFKNLIENLKTSSATVSTKTVVPAPAAESSPTLNEFNTTTDAAVPLPAQPPTLESMLENLDVHGGSANPPEEPSQPQSLDELLNEVDPDSVPQSPEPATQTE